MGILIQCNPSYDLTEMVLVPLEVLSCSPVNIFTEQNDFIKGW